MSAEAPSVSLGEKRSRSPPEQEQQQPTPAAAPAVLAALAAAASPEAFERAHVHDVYNVIAPHFSSTRYKPWPRVRAFVEACVEANRRRNEPTATATDSTASEKEEGGEDVSTSATAGPSPALVLSPPTSASSSAAALPLPYGILLADVGCGNGKNMCIHDLSSCYGVGCDRSIELMRAAALGARRTRVVEVVEVPREAKDAKENKAGKSDDKAKEGESGDAANKEPTAKAEAEGGEVPVPNKASRKKGGGGKQPQPPQTKKQIRVSTEVAVPEALERGLEHCGSDAIETPYRSGIFDIVISIAVVHHFSTHERRLAAIRELLRLCVPVTGRVLVYAWAKEQARDRGAGVDVFVPWALHQKFANRAANGADGGGKAEEKSVLQRYYHLFVKGELEELCLAVNDPANDPPATATSSAPIRCRIEESFFDQENWCIVLSRTQ